MCSLWVLMCSFGFNHNYRSDTDCQHRAEFISPRKPPTSGRGLRIFFLVTEAESVSFLCCSLVSPVSTLALSYLVIHPSISRREEEEETGADTVTDKLVLSASTLTWLMNLLTQWLTPENWVTKKSPGRPDVLSYGFLLSSLTLTLSFIITSPQPSRRERMNTHSPEENLQPPKGEKNRINYFDL